MRLYYQKWKFELEYDLVHYTRLAAGGAFENRYLRIAEVAGGRWEITVREGYRHDACTGVPDLAGTENAAPLHDALYQWAEDLARAWGWSVWRVLAWADGLFRERMKQDGAAKWVERLYFWGVRVLGYAFHMTAKWFRRVVDRPLGMIRT